MKRILALLLLALSSRLFAAPIYTEAQPSQHTATVVHPSSSWQWFPVQGWSGQVGVLVSVTDTGNSYYFAFTSVSGYASPNPWGSVGASANLNLFFSREVIGSEIQWIGIYSPAGISPIYLTNVW